MSKKLQFGLTLTCLICVLAIFIAPSIEMPETVLLLHHTTLRATGTGPAGAAAIAIGGTLELHQHTSDSAHAARTSRPPAPMVREVSTVMRC